MKTRPEIVMAWEPLAGLLDDGLAHLVALHHAEVGVHKEEMPLDCDWEQYHDLDQKGILRTLSARLKGKLIGYNSFMTLKGHIHYRRTFHALGDAIFVHKDQRSTGAGPLMIDRAERDLAALAAPGYCRIIYHDKAFLEFLGPLLKKRGYTRQEDIWDKMVKAS